MNASSLIVRMVRLFAAQARLYCLSVGTAGLLGIVSLTAISIFMVRGAGEGPLDSRVLWEAMGFSRKFISIFGVTFALWTPILLGARAVCRITADQLSNKPTASLPRVLADMIRFLPAALVYSLLIGFPTLIGAAILVVPGVVAAAIFILVVPTSVNEPGGLIQTYFRGISLANKVFVKGLIITTICSALVLLIVVLRILFVDRFLPDTRILYALRFTLTYIPALFILILANICYSLLYIEGREKFRGSPQPQAGLQ
jgi:hypothetical protein